MPQHAPHPDVHGPRPGAGPAASAARDPALDGLRVLAFFLMVPYHVALVFTTRAWFVADGEPSALLARIMRVPNYFRVPLLFFVSGLVLARLLERRAPRVLLRDRLLRLGVPLVFGTLVVVPPQRLLGWLSRSPGQPLGELLAFCFTPQSFFPRNFVWHHLWFLAYLAPFTAVLLAAGGRAPWARRWTALGAGWPAAVGAALLAVDLTLGGWVPSSHDLFSDGANLLSTFILFAAGFGIGRRPSLDAFWREIDDLVWIAGVAAVGATIALDAAPVADPSRLGFVEFLVLRALRVVATLAWIILLLGLAKRWIRAGSPLLSYCNEATLPWYVLHQTVIVAVAYALLPVRLSSWPKFLLEVVLAIAGTALVYEVGVRRWPAARFLMGMRPLPPRGDGETATAFGRALESLAPFRRRSPALVAAVAVLAGGVLRIWYFAASGSLWLDELALSENVLTRGLGELLLRPLELDQVAPAGFLVLEKIAATLGGGSELALRAVPLAASLAALVVFRRVAFRLLGGAAAAFATVVFALTPALVLSAADAKPYATDVLASVALLALASAHRGRAHSRRGKYVVFVAGGLAALLLSYTAGLVLASVTAALVGRAAAARRWSEVRAWALAVVVLALGGAAVLLLHLQSVSPETVAYLERFWAHAFMPLAPTPEVVAWPYRKLSEAFASHFLYPAATFHGALVFVGLAAAWRRRRLLVLAGAPLALALAASAARQHPFAVRQVTYLAPQLVLLMAAVVDLGVGVARRHRIRSGSGGPTWRVTVPVVVALLLAPLAWRWTSAAPSPAKQETRQVFERVARERRPGDAVYVYYGGWLAMRRYGSRHGLGDGDVVVGGCHRRERVGYLAELNEALRGRSRIWIVTTHEFQGEGALLREYLGAVGTRRGGFEIPGNAPHLHARADLFDVEPNSDLEAALARFVRTNPSATMPARVPDGVGCDGGPYVPTSHRLEVARGRTRG